jgi:SAM-dependent MidA family methyltransferase
VSGSTKQITSTLAAELAERIRQEGKIAFRDWMAAALYHPTLGYYNRTDLKRWGRAGDYRTSPERSELFAASFARYFATLYDRMHRPSSLTIVEMGAGDGRFASRVLDALEDKYPTVFNATRYAVVELSEDARLRITEELQRFVGRVDFECGSELKSIQSGIVVSNELLDAFPVHRVISLGGVLKELYVTVQGDFDFDWSTGELSSSRLREFCRNHLPVLSEGQIVDVNLGIEDWFGNVAENLLSGYLITVDYGAESEDLYHRPERHRGTLRAFRRHEFVDHVLEMPGEYDITSTVDWSYVKLEGQRHGFEVEEFAPLDRFLMRVGVLEELEARLEATSSDVEKSCLTTAAREMILPTGMAGSFQVLVQKRSVP